MEDPGGSVDDILPTAPPLMNLTNNSLSDGTERDSDKNKFYLPVSDTLMTAGKVLLKFS